MFESVRRFLKNLRRKHVVKSKYPVTPWQHSRRGQKKLAQKALRILAVKEDQAYGIAFADGAFSNLENRWVRKALHREKKLYRHDRPPAQAKG